MAIPRTLGCFPRRRHSRMQTAKRERCGPRGGAVWRACVTCLAPINKLIQAGGPMPFAWVNGLAPGLLRAIWARKLTACMVYRLLLVNR